MVSSPVWLTHVVAFSPAPNAHCAELSGAGIPGIGAFGLATASARACPLFDCDANLSAWHARQASLPAYCPASGSAVAIAIAQKNLCMATSGQASVTAE